MNFPLAAEGHLGAVVGFMALGRRAFAGAVVVGDDGDVVGAAAGTAGVISVCVTASCTEATGFSCLNKI